MLDYAKEVMDPFAGPQNEKGKASGEVIDRTKDAQPNMIDLDFWHPGNDKLAPHWFRYASTMREVFESDEGYQGGARPEKSRAAMMYPTKARFVEQSTGIILAMKEIDKNLVVDLAAPGFETISQLKDRGDITSRAERRTAERDIKKQQEKLKKRLDKREKGQEVDEP